MNTAGIVIGTTDKPIVDNHPVSSSDIANDGAYSAPPRHILIVRQRSVQIDDNGMLTTIQTTRLTVGEILYEAGLSLYVADQITPDPSALIADNGLITIKRSIPLRILVDGHMLSTRTHGKTVGAVLAEVGVAPVGLDYVTPIISASISANIEIRIVRVTEEDIVQQVPLPFKHILQAIQHCLLILVRSFSKD